ARSTSARLPRNHTSNRCSPPPTLAHSPNRLQYFCQVAKSDREAAFSPTFLDSPIQCEKCGLAGLLLSIPSLLSSSSSDSLALPSWKYGLGLNPTVILTC